jgi:hypothetical protein
MVPNINIEEYEVGDIVVDEDGNDWFVDINIKTTVKFWTKMINDQINDSKVEEFILIDAGENSVLKITIDHIEKLKKKKMNKYAKKKASNFDHLESVLKSEKYKEIIPIINKDIVVDKEILVDKEIKPKKIRVIIKK